MLSGKRELSLRKGLVPVEISNFISVGENIHCTRIYKVGGKFVKAAANGQHEITYQAGDETHSLPVPDSFTGNADWQAGKVKHCAVAIWHGNYGNEAGKAAGIDYLSAQAQRQEQSGATYLDINVDEFSTDIQEKIKLMKWTVEIIQQASSLPICIDSSNLDILRAGLEACDPAREKPMLNSVSLERLSALKLASEFKTVVIASAAGENDLPTTPAGRLANLETLMPSLEAAGLEPCDIHIDPLVFPISTDGNNGKGFLETVSAIRDKYGPEIHVVAGLSNISFGMPNRKLINQAFAWLSVESGADGGIVDPLQINTNILNSLDVESEPFKLTKALLLGEDDFGMNYISAYREGILS